MRHHHLLRVWLKIQRWLRGSEMATIAIAIAVGLGAGLTTWLQGFLAHGLQQIIYGVGINRLSALVSIRHPWKLLALPLGGLVLMQVRKLADPKRAPVDVVEANALFGGRVPLADSLHVCAQTMVSNGFGASVGLEAAYTQAGGAVASLIGRWLGLKRETLRVLVGAGAGASIGAAFGAPLAGAFYGFEIVIGAYAPAAIAPVMAAALSARVVVRLFGGSAYLVAPGIETHVRSLDYPVFAALGIGMALVGIGLMRAQAWLEAAVQKLPLARWRPVLGGVLLIPIAYVCPQSLSSGHGALRLDLALHPDVQFLLTVFALKALASVVALAFGFRGGLFFASLLLGSLAGQAAAQGIDLATGLPLLDPTTAALVGMAALAVTVVGGPMCLALLVLESTHDFPLTGVVVMAVLCASAFARANFGYSFSTWRMHLRGSAIRSARDQGWMREIPARRLMRRAPVVVSAGATVAAFRAAVPLGSTSRVLLAGPGGHYEGTVLTAAAYDPRLAGESAVADLAQVRGTSVAAEATLADILDRFDAVQVEDLAVVDGEGRILGVLTERYVRRRQAEELEKQQARLFGEGV